MDDFSGHFTVWRIESVATNVVYFKAERSYPEWPCFVNAGRYPVWSGIARTKEDAAKKWENEGRPVKRVEM